ncbi:MAG: Phage-related baseplate assembly protein [Bacteroidetes bacterium ADurb.Bin302]|nr:MAG: Phage-related baseplate assembly protein [Bacteroidetes bacterium ADurb.Bin302]
MFYDKYDGVYVGEVVDNKDPDMLGRIRVKVPNIYGSISNESIPWANPCFPYGYDDQGIFFIPEVGSFVIVMFINKSPHRPIWLGSVFRKDENVVPNEIKSSYPQRKIIKTKVGYVLFDDKKNDIMLSHSNGSSITMKKNGDIKISATRDVVIDSGRFVMINCGMDSLIAQLAPGLTSVLNGVLQSGLMALNPLSVLPSTLLNNVFPSVVNGLLSGDLMDQFGDIINGNLDSIVGNFSSQIMNTLNSELNNILGSAGLSNIAGLLSGAGLSSLSDLTNISGLSDIADLLDVAGISDLANLANIIGTTNIEDLATAIGLEKLSELAEIAGITDITRLANMVELVKNIDIDNISEIGEDMFNNLASSLISDFMPSTISNIVDMAISSGTHELTFETVLGDTIFDATDVYDTRLNRVNVSRNGVYQLVNRDYTINHSNNRYYVVFSNPLDEDELIRLS